MCFDLDSRPPIVPIAGGALDSATLTLTADDGARIDGKDATIERLDPTPPCGAIGGEREIVVTIPGGAANWTEMRACIRGPSFAAIQAQIDVMLAPVIWHE